MSKPVPAAPAATAPWATPIDAMLARVGTTPAGLASAEAQARLAADGPNRLGAKRSAGWPRLLLGQFSSPMILILVGASALSLFLQDYSDAGIILVIVAISGLLGFWQEHSAAGAVAKLLALVKTKATVLRDAQRVDVPTDEVVAGDVVVLDAGDAIPGDCVLLESNDLFVDEAALTGESYPVEKRIGPVAPDTPLSQRSGSLWLGTHVLSGGATALVVATGRKTEFGKISDRLVLRPPETEFERGVRRFGYLLMNVTLVMLLGIFAVNIALARPVLDSFLFSLALAIGLTPQLLPAIISVNLARGSRRMAQHRVIVKRLSSIEDFGAMDVLCSDKTGTLTEGIVRVQATLDPEGNPSDRVFEHAYLNAIFEQGFTNPVDEAVRTHRTLDVSRYTRLGEAPYDFVRKRLSVLVADGATHVLVTKGALANVLDACESAEAGGQVVPIASVRAVVDAKFEALSQEGLRVMGVARKDVPDGVPCGKALEAGMTFLGFLVLHDPPKEGAARTVDDLRKIGVALKVITGDNRLVAASVGRQLGLAEPRVLAGPEIRQMSDEALCRRVIEVDLFAETEPNQKERLVLALKKAGHVVGYLGDGINDASALHAADVGISVDDAVDVAKEAADIVLLEKDLSVLLNGIREGRRTFSNTLKYVFMATSANFGNMFSMAGASLFLPFLPLLPKQILLTNLLTDLPEMAIARDRVDPEWLDRPRRWDLGFIRNFMITFGLVSSLFDYATFGVLLWILGAQEAQFRTGWFLESVVSASMIVFVIRTRRPFFRSRPSFWLVLPTIVMIAATVALPFTPLAPLLGFAPLPLMFLPWLGLILVLYVGAAELAKVVFYRRMAAKART